MIKKILYWLMVAAIVAGAVYSYNKVEFGRSTAMFFQVVFGDENSMGPGGRPPTGGQPPGARPEGGQGRGPSSEGGVQVQPPMQGNTQGQPPNFQPGGKGGRMPQGDTNRPAGPGGAGGPGGVISVKNVIPYTFILAFFVLITCVLERTIKRVFYSNS